MRSPAMVGKRVQFDDATYSLINLLRRERRRSFQQLADEAFRDLLEKHGHPIKLGTDEAPSISHLIVGRVVWQSESIDLDP